MANERRVYRKELRERLGWSRTWYATQQQRGVIPYGRRDPGGKREWFTNTEANRIVRQLTKAAVPAGPP